MVNLVPLSNKMFKNLEEFNLDGKAPDILISCGKRSIYASLFLGSEDSLFLPKQYFVLSISFLNNLLYKIYYLKIWTFSSHSHPK